MTKPSEPKVLHEWEESALRQNDARFFAARYRMVHVPDRINGVDATRPVVQRLEGERWNNGLHSGPLASELARLAAECAALKAENERLKHDYAELNGEHSDLLAAWRSTK
jgi:hypothetical protein